MGSTREGMERHKVEDKEKSGVVQCIGGGGDKEVGETQNGGSKTERMWSYGQDDNTRNETTI